MLKRFFIFFAISIASQSLIAEDSLSIQNRVLDRLTPVQNFIKTPFDNPALHYYKYKNSLSSFSLNGLYDYQQQSVIQELGKGEEAFSVNANSFLVFNKNSRIWGSATYKNGKKKDVKGNETSDFALVYPYMTADSIGGDINSETYAFEGGYAYSHKKITCGAEFSYRSLLEYRQIDPRPRNIVADLNVKAGMAYALSNRYKGGISLYYQRYKQNGDITFYNELGFSSIIHLSGLGMDYTRFAGKQSSYAYKGNKIGATISLLPTTENGFSATVDYSMFTYDKELKALNNLPMNKLDVHNVKAEMAWRKEINNQNNIAVKANGSFSNKNGTENIFGSSSDAYIQISSAKQFTSHEMNAELEALYQKKENNNMLWFVNPSAWWSNKKDKYLIPNREWEIGTINYGIGMGTIIAKEYNITLIKVNINRQQNNKNILSISQYSSPNYFQRIIMSNNRWLTSNQWQIGVTLRKDFTLKAFKEQSFFIEGNWNYNLYDDSSMHTHLITASVGMNL